MTTTSEHLERGPHAAPAPPAPREFKQARASASYERILVAALQLYGERGFQATQTPDIAERAGMSVGGLYRYFRDKHQIFLEVVHRALEHNRQEQDRMVAEIEVALAAGEADLQRFVEQLVDWTWKTLLPVPPDLLRTFAAMAYIDPAFAELSDQYDRYERQAFARVLRELTSRRRVPSPLVAAGLIDLIIPAVGIWAALHPDEARGVKKATIDMLYRYLSDEGSPPSP